MKLAITLYFLALLAARAATYASNGTLSDVQSKINGAVFGDTVTVPSGTFSWTGTLTITKGIKLQGAGAGRSRGSSTDSLTIGTGSKSFTVQAGLGFTAGEAIRAHYKADQANNYMTGTVTSYSGTSLVINVTSTTGSGTYAAWSFQQDGATKITHDAGSSDLIQVTEDTNDSVRIEDIHFEYGTGTGHLIVLSSGGASAKPLVMQRCQIVVTGAPVVIDSFSNKGVFSQIDFRNIKLWNGTPATAQCFSWPSVSQTSWSTASTMGTADSNGDKNTYIEGCWFNSFFTQCMDFDGGCRVVVRYNYFDHSGLTSHGMDSGVYSMRHVELYNNTFIFHNLNASTAPLDYWFYMRGGTGVIYNNTIDDISSGQFGNKNEFKLTIQHLQRSAGPYPCWGANIAGNQYPAPRQVGMGYVNGSGTTDGSSRYLGDSEPLYIWGNTGTYVVSIEDYGGVECTNPDSSSNYILSGRDYYNDGTAKPSWTAYTYPHPLRGGGGGGGGSSSGRVKHRVRTNTIR